MLKFTNYLEEQKELLLMSAAADKYERDVAEYIDSLDGVKAERPKVSTKYADVVLSYNNKRTWLEVKMNHTDNLGNPRVSYIKGQWGAAKPIDPVKKFAMEYLSKSPQTKKFLKEISQASNIPVNKMILPSTKGLLKQEGAVPYVVIADFFKDRSQYILDVKNVDLGKLVTDHYLEGKAEPAHYMQAGDDFYMIGNKNPLGLPKDIPLLSGKGTFRMRIGVRSERSAFYEIQPEIKITDMPKSKYSLKPETKKKNPFYA